METLNADKNVYLLGAGFSRELGLPLQNDFLLIAKEVYFRDPKRYKHFESVFQYQDKLSKMRKFLNYPLLNLEHLFNIMEMDIFYSNNKQVESIKDEFVKLIRDVLMEETPAFFYNDTHGNLMALTKYDSYLSFLNLFIEKTERGQLSTRDDTIVTFNYDLVVEAAVSLYNWVNDRKREQGGQRYHFLRLDTMLEKTNIISDDINGFFFRDEKPKYCPPVAIYPKEEPAIKLI